MEPFVKIRRGRKTALVHPEFREAVGDALLEGRGCAPAGLEGRGEILRFEYEGGTALVRRFRRGGFIRHFVRDAYLLANRPLAELRIHRHVYEQGLPVPLPLGVCWERRGPLYRGLIATEELDGVNLLEYLERDSGDAERVLRGCGEVIRRMHDLGVEHADLQVRNLLVGEAGPHVIDFDKARLRTSMGEKHRARNLLRLRRSMAKNGVAARCFVALCEGYGGGSLPPWLAAKGIIAREGGEGHGYAPRP